MGARLNVWTFGVCSHQNSSDTTREILAWKVNSKENIQACYRNGSRILNWCVNKTSQNYGAYTNWSFIIT